MRWMLGSIVDKVGRSVKRNLVRCTGEVMSATVS